VKYWTLSCRNRNGSSYAFSVGESQMSLVESPSTGELLLASKMQKAIGRRTGEDGIRCDWTGYDTLMMTQSVREMVPNCWSSLQIACFWNVDFCGDAIRLLVYNGMVHYYFKFKN